MFAKLFGPRHTVQDAVVILEKGLRSGEIHMGSSENTHVTLLQRARDALAAELNRSERQVAEMEVAIAQMEELLGRWLCEHDYECECGLCLETSAIVESEMRGNG